MELIKSNGQVTFINDDGIETYKKYLENNIMELDKASKTRGLSQDEIRQINEYMYLYNQIVDNTKKESLKSTRIK